jgi:hypothetical protein
MWVIHPPCERTGGTADGQGELLLEQMDFSVMSLPNAPLMYENKEHVLQLLTPHTRSHIFQLQKLDTEEVIRAVRAMLNLQR